jgi:hypothetical protein
MISIVMAQVGEGFSTKLIPHMRDKRVLFIARCRSLELYRQQEYAKENLIITYIHSTKQIEQIALEAYELIVIEEVASTTLNMKRLRQLIKDAKCDIIIRPDDFLRTIRGISNYRLKVISSKV